MITALIDNKSVPDVMSAIDLWEACEAFSPRESLCMLDWCRSNIVTDQGRPYDHAAYPHLGAPGGPCDAYDDPKTRTLSFQFATRLGKTFFGQCASLKTADCDPAPQMMVSSNEKLAKEVMSRTYAMIHRREKLNSKLIKKPIDQRQDLIEFAECRIWAAWARSAATLADKNIKVGHANELDDWEHRSTSKDGDPQKLFSDRFKDFQSVRKIVFESVPKVKGRSRIEALRLAGTNCRFEVPCPHCQRYQRLEWNRVEWERDENGRHNPTIAKNTAYYRCLHCNEVVNDHHRAWMIRRGVWCAEGCDVLSDEALRIAEHELARPINAPRAYVWSGWKLCPWVTGEPVRDGEDASYQLGSQYALSLRWGDLGKEWVTCYKKPQLLRNLINQWMGETWEASQSKTDPEKVGERLRSEYQRGIVPEWAVFLTFQADRQAADGGFIPFAVMAHGPGERSHVVEYGVCRSLDEAHSERIRQQYQHADGGNTIAPAISAIDSGFNTKDTYDFCSSHVDIFPVKGSSASLGGNPYRIVRLDGGNTRTGADGQTLIHVDTDFWETDLQHRLEDLRPGEEGSLSLCYEASHDLEFLEQVCNGQMAEVNDSRGNAKLLWVKKEESIPNDFRDVIRYGLCLARAYVEELGGYPARSKINTSYKAVVSSGDTRPDGRGWLDT